MADAPRSNRPSPRTPAAAEAELRRRIRTELSQARAETESGELSDDALAQIIARAAAAVLGWHLEAPEHTRNASLSSRSWRPAAGPRGARGYEDEQDRRSRDRGSRDFDRGPRDFERGPRDFERGPRFERGPGEFDRPPRDFDRGFKQREFDNGPRRPAPRGGGFSRGGGFKRGGGGFGPRRQPRAR